MNSTAKYKLGLDLLFFYLRSILLPLVFFYFRLLRIFSFCILDVFVVVVIYFLVTLNIILTNTTIFFTKRLTKLVTKSKHRNDYH